MTDWKRPLCTWGVLLLALPGCRGDSRPSDQPPPGFVRYDSSGVTISVTPGHLANAPLPWVISESPDLVIGDETAPGELIFSVAGVAPLRDGGLVVVDGGDKQIRIFDAAGALRGTLGGLGRGPGEFEDISLAPGVVGDSLIVYDGALRRFHHVSASDLGFRVQTVPTVTTGRPPLGVVGDRVLFGWGFLRGRPARGVRRYPVTFRWVDLDTEAETRITSLVIESQFAEVVPGQPAPTAWPIPFTAHYPPAVATNGGALIYRGGAAELMEYGLDGQPRRVWRIDVSSRPVTDELIETWVQGFASMASVPESRVRRVVETIPLPTTLPWFASLLNDEEGSTWAGVFEPVPGEQEPATWIVFDDEGRASGTVATPEGLEVHAITSTAILGVWTSPLGVQEVRRHSLERR